MIFFLVATLIGSLLVGQSSASEDKQVRQVFPVDRATIVRMSLYDVSRELLSQKTNNKPGVGQEVAELLESVKFKNIPIPSLRIFSANQLLHLNSISVDVSDCTREEIKRRKDVCLKIENIGNAYVLTYCKETLNSLVNSCKDNIGEILNNALARLDQTDLSRMKKFSEEVSSFKNKKGKGHEKELVESVLEEKAPFYRNKLRRNCVSLHEELSKDVYFIEESSFLLLNMVPTEYNQIIGRCKHVEQLVVVDHKVQQSVV